MYVYVYQYIYTYKSVHAYQSNKFKTIWGSAAAKAASAKDLAKEAAMSARVAVVSVKDKAFADSDSDADGPHESLPPLVCVCV